MDPEVVADSHHNSSNGAGKQVNFPCLDPSSITFVVGKKVQQFPKHDTVKLDFILETTTVPTQFVVNKDGQLVKNFDYVLHVQQDKLLAYWLLPTMFDEILIYLTSARTIFDLWATIERKFATKSTIKISSLRHALYSQKKDHISIKDYLAKIKSMSDTLIAARSIISKQE
ncbi:hypothetical protein Gotur_034433 [Gossypium turneri]